MPTLVAGLDVSFHDPLFEVSIGGEKLSAEISRFIEAVQYESADGYADMIKLTVQNPEGVFTDSKLFQVGNEMNVSFGYGSSIAHVGRGIISRPKYRFPQDSIPTIEITAYTKDFLMMDSAPARGGKKKPAKRSFEKPASLKAMINTVSEEYGFLVDVGTEITFDRSFVQKAGMSDYDFIKQLSNTTGYVFWVDGDETGQWALHFLDPDDRGILPEIQNKQYTFEYNRGDASTLLSFEPEFALRDARTKIIVIACDDQTGKVWTEEVVEDANAPDGQSSGDPEELLDEPHESGGAEIKLIFGEQFSIETIANKKFTSHAEVKRWAKQWFCRHRQDFIQGRGTLIGIEDLFARQVHKIKGLGVSLDGEYYFPRVRHQLTSGEGYQVDFHARRVIG